MINVPLPTQTWGHIEDGQTINGLEFTFPAILCPTYYGFPGGKILSVTVSLVGASLPNPPRRTVLGIYTTGGNLIKQSEEIVLTEDTTSIIYPVEVDLPAGDYCIGISTDADTDNFLLLVANNTFVPYVSDETTVYSSILPPTLTIFDTSRQNKISVKYIGNTVLQNSNQPLAIPDNVEINNTRVEGLWVKFVEPWNLESPWSYESIIKDNTQVVNI
jgi:hypothetical protein